MPAIVISAMSVILISCTWPPCPYRLRKEYQVILQFNIVQPLEIPFPQAATKPSLIVRPVSESESERQRARNGTSESERDFSRERATIHTSESKRAKFKTARDFSFYSAVPWGSDCSDVCSI